MNTAEKIKALQDLLQDIQATAMHERAALEDCPLRADHYALSEIIFGQGCWKWTCGFCGEQDSE